MTAKQFFNNMLRLTSMFCTLSKAEKNTVKKKKKKERLYDCKATFEQHTKAKLKFCTSSKA